MRHSASFMTHSVSAMTQSASLCDHNVGSSLYRGRLQSSKFGNKYILFAMLANRRVGNSILLHHIHSVFSLWRVHGEARKFDITRRGKGRLR